MTEFEQLYITHIVAQRAVQMRHSAQNRNDQDGTPIPSNDELMKKAVDELFINKKLVMEYLHRDWFLDSLKSVLEFG